MGREVGAGRLAGGSRGHRAERGQRAAAHERVGGVAHRLFRRHRDGRDVLKAQPLGIEARFLEQTGVEDGLLRGRDRLRPEAAELHLAARLLIERWPAQKLGGGRTDGAKLTPGLDGGIHQPIEGSHAQGQAKEYGRSEA